MQPLFGVKVLDLSRLIPGPFCSRILVDLGARVTKIEDPGQGDYLRNMGGSLYDALNRGKKIVRIDLKSARGRNKFFELVKKSDVVIESFRPGVLKRLGLSFNDLKKVNRRVIVASITGFGQTGPNRDKAGHDLNYVSLAGIPGLDKVPSLQWADLVGGGIMGALSIVAALGVQKSRRRAVHLDISMTDSMIFCGLGPILLSQTGENLDVLSGVVGRYQIYRTSDDRLVSLAALEDKFWNRFCDLIGHVEWKDSSFRFPDTDPAIKERLTTIFRGRTRDEWKKLGEENDICLTPVLSPAEVAASSQFCSRRFHVRRKKNGRDLLFPKFPIRQVF